MAPTVDLEAALLTAMEFGIRGDTGSLRQYARQLLKKAGPNDTALRHALSRLLAEAGGAASSLRGVGGATSSVMGDEEEFTRLEQPEVLAAPVLPDDLSASLEEILHERASLPQLLRAGVAPTRSLLLVGPPGVGKTMTAKYLAAKMEVPLLTVDLSAVMSRFLGRTGQNLRLALQKARFTPSVCLLDEFDALAKKRDDPTDVGELKRIVTIVLHELESWPAHSLIVAATNHPELLDRAVWRRFDRVLNFVLPSDRERPQIVAAEMERNGYGVNADALAILRHTTDGWSGSDLVRISREAIRGVVLSRWSNIERALVELILRDSDCFTSSKLDDPRAEFIRLAKERAGLSQRSTARLLGLSHVTIGKVLRSQ